MVVRFKKEGTYVYMWLIHVDIWQKPVQYYKAVILQLKIYIYIFKCMAELDVGNPQKSES